MFTLDDTFMTAVKTLIQDADLRKQWLGTVLLAVVFNPRIAYADRDLFGKHVNAYLAQISTTLNKHELLGQSDMFGAGVKAFMTAVELVHKDYDQKLHASALQLIK